MAGGSNQSEAWYPWEEISRGFSAIDSEWQPPKSLKSFNLLQFDFLFVKIRLDRLVEKVRLLDRRRKAGPFEKTLLGQYADGKLDEATMKTLLAAHEREVATVTRTGPGERTNHG